MAKPVWIVNLTKTFFPNRFFLARLTHLPLIGKILDRLMFKGDHIIYLPREKVIKIDTPVEESLDMVLPSQIVDYFIRSARHRWIMNTCICREATQCKDYPVHLGCLFLGEAVLGINPELGHLATKEEALDHVEHCRRAGLIHLIGRNKLDTLWLGVGPPERLMTICSCCPCCCLWRVLPHLHPSIAGRVTKMEGVTVSTTVRCTGCGTCTKNVCFAGAIRLTNGKALITDACRGCGRCVDVCPQKAIRLTISDSRFLEKSIELLSKSVNVN